MKKGLFITFEGNDGSGKTTIATRIFETLQKEGYDVIFTREPGGIAIAEQIRKVILNPDNTSMDGRCEALLYAAARRQHLVEKVVPALEAGKIVLCDRFVDSSLAYQGVARGLGIEEVYQINQFAIEGHMPDATIFLKVDSKIGLSRIQSRGNLDRLDAEGESFHTLVAKGYEEVLERYRNRITVIDASLDVDSVFENAYKVIKDLVD